MTPEGRQRPCGYTLVDPDGEEYPCNRPATGWRWYQDVPHDDSLMPACELHANEGGRRMHAAEAVAQKRGQQLTDWTTGFNTVLRTAYQRAEAAEAKVQRVEALTGVEVVDIRGIRHDGMVTTAQIREALDGES